MPEVQQEAQVHQLPAADSTPRLAAAIEAAQRRLLDLQRADGHWRGELEGDSILESEYALTLLFLGRGDHPRFFKAAAWLRERQLPAGGWAPYPGGVADVSATAKAYFVLKLAGDDPEAEHMRRAREVVRRHGGLDACNSFTRIYLAVFGQYPWERCPAVPPELVLLPRWAPFSVYELSAWSRAIVVPLSIVWARRPHVAVPEAAAIPELMVPGGRSPNFATSPRWAAIFRAVDLALQQVEQLRLTPMRRRALARAESWILERLRKSDGLGAIFPPIVNTIMAMRCLGYPLDDPRLAAQIDQLERLVIEGDASLKVEPCFSPVWDTALAINALVESGVPPDHPAVLSAARWLLDHEVTEAGDWRETCPDGPVGGWYFEYANEFYPDCDDTAQVLTALSKVRFPAAVEEERRRAACDRALSWVRAMQCSNGGWGSFDRDCDRWVLTQVPFADHNAMIDPPTADITGRVLEAARALGVERTSPWLERAVGFVLATQESDGAWYGRWGVNYIYGTWLALWGLERAGLDVSEPWARRAAAWLRGCQNDDGGWGESPDSYDDPSLRGRGPSTAAQTAWALLGLAAAGDPPQGAVERGLAFLMEGQLSDGGWLDEPWTGTGFPRVFYLRYHLYATYFPLLALSVWARRLHAGEPGRAA